MKRTRISCSSSIRLPGQQYDEESGLYYNRHRYYDPLQGRYITQDPIGLKGGMEFLSVSVESGHKCRSARFG
ncbi:RHS repeat-associated core domain-containing protein [Escherichia coli]|uniref:RHS repeat-associated core domain-containing protein n=1 Tax=Escherichia coli TaxID=562 RepID=UPI00208DB840|nr:RHS repeat-associated core domain-containing protein [Escherichia coli]